MTDLEFKRILLIVFLVSVVFTVPVTAIITTIIFENTHIKEVREYDELKVHELYKNKWNYCPNCGAKLESEEHDVDRQNN